MAAEGRPSIVRMIPTARTVIRSVRVKALSLWLWPFNPYGSAARITRSLLLFEPAERTIGFLGLATTLFLDRLKASQMPRRPQRRHPTPCERPSRAHGLPVRGACVNFTHPAWNSRIQV